MSGVRIKSFRALGSDGKKHTILIEALPLRPNEAFDTTEQECDPSKWRYCTSEGREVERHEQGTYQVSQTDLILKSFDSNAP